MWWAVEREFRNSEYIMQSELKKEEKPLSVFSFILRLAFPPPPPPFCYMQCYSTLCWKHFSQFKTICLQSKETALCSLFTPKLLSFQRQAQPLLSPSIHCSFYSCMYIYMKNDYDDKYESKKERRLGCLSSYLAEETEERAEEKFYYSLKAISLCLLFMCLLVCLFAWSEQS